MSPTLARREAALAGVALLAALATLAFARGGKEPLASEPVLGPGASWKLAAVSAYRPQRYGRQTGCGARLTRTTVGIVHPVLPCGVRLVVSFAGRQVEAAVVERAPTADGDDFELTAGLARALGVRGRSHIRWRFAG